jgi:hypothetical protein
MRWPARFKIPEFRQFDWRGWITLAWVLWCGWAYAVMAVQERGPLVREWLRALGKWVGWF